MPTFAGDDVSFFFTLHAIHWHFFCHFSFCHMQMIDTRLVSEMIALFFLYIKKQRTHESTFATKSTESNKKTALQFPPLSFVHSLWSLCMHLLNMHSLSPMRFIVILRLPFTLLQFFFHSLFRLMLFFLFFIFFFKYQSNAWLCLRWLFAAMMCVQVFPCTHTNAHSHR